MDDKEKYMRWLETMWDLHNNISREEKRKAEVLEVFEGLAPLEAPRRGTVFPALGALPVVEGLLKSQRKLLLDAGGTRPPSPGR